MHISPNDLKRRPTGGATRANLARTAGRRRATLVSTARLRMHLVEGGAGEPVLLLHGWPQHWQAWRQLIPLLSARHRVLCPDLRGFGWTDAPRDGHDTARL